MEAQSRPPPISPRCLKCGEQPKFTSSMLDTLTARTFHMFECKCGSQTWTSEKNLGPVAPPIRRVKRICPPQRPTTRPIEN